MQTEKKLSIFMKKHPVWYGIIIVAFCIFLLLITIDKDSNSTGNVIKEVEDIQQGEKECVSDWSCGSWSECSSSGMQTRICTDLNNCETNLDKPSEAQICTAPKNYIKKTYDDTCKIFDYDSKYTDIQKEKIFEEEYESKYVKWTGTISDIDFSVWDNLRMEVMMSCGTGRIYMNQNQYDKLILLSKGDKVTFVGRFDTEPTFKLFGGIHFILKEGETWKT